MESQWIRIIITMVFLEQTKSNEPDRLDHSGPLCILKYYFIIFLLILLVFIHFVNLMKSRKKLKNNDIHNSTMFHNATMQTMKQNEHIDGI